MFSTQHFTTGIVESIADAVIAPTLIAARAAVITWDRAMAIATHPRTVKAAKIAAWSIYIGAVVAFALGKTARILVQSWVDAEVNAALPAVKPVALLMPAAEPEPEETDADPFSPAANPHFEAAVNAFDAFIEKGTASPTAKEPTLQDLRKECIERNKALPKGDPRRIKRAGHLTKQEALAALGRI